MRDIKFTIAHSHHSFRDVVYRPGVKSGPASFRGRVQKAKGNTANRACSSRTFGQLTSALKGHSSKVEIEHPCFSLPTGGKTGFIPCERMSTRKSSAGPVGFSFMGMRKGLLKLKRHRVGFLERQSPPISMFTDSSSCTTGTGGNACNTRKHVKPCGERQFYGAEASAGLKLCISRKSPKCSVGRAGISLHRPTNFNAPASRLETRTKPDCLITSCWSANFRTELALNPCLRETKKADKRASVLAGRIGAIGRSEPSPVSPDHTMPGLPRY